MSTHSARHPASRLIVQGKERSTVSCDAIPGYMDAMVMPFEVSDPALLKALVPGTTVRFSTMVERKHEETMPSIYTRADHQGREL